MRRSKKVSSTIKKQIVVDEHEPFWDQLKKCFHILEKTKEWVDKLSGAVAVLGDEAEKSKDESIRLLWNPLDYAYDNHVMDMDGSVGDLKIILDGVDFWYRFPTEPKTLHFPSVFRKKPIAEDEFITWENILSDMRRELCKQMLQPLEIKDELTMVDRKVSSVLLIFYNIFYTGY
jgi:hypothetical protein